MKQEQKSKTWFEVSKEGLQALQLGKPKHYVLRELIQNAWDENTKECNVDCTYQSGKTTIVVTDDSPEGFLDIRDSFTLFGDTRKRKNPEKRGRFNLGEKQAFAICETASIVTTTGSVVFDKTGRSVSDTKRPSGSQISVTFKSSKSEYDEMIEIVKRYLVPKEIVFKVNGHTYNYKKPFQTREAILTTEIENDKILTRTKRKTRIDIHKAEGQAYLYEMGIPVQPIDCDYDVDVQQKIPLGVDRESVLPSFLKDVFTEVLNATYEDIQTENSSALWVRTGMTGKNVEQEAVKDIITKRFGDKVLVANPFDRNSIDEAISEGYRVITGSEMSKDEWDTIKANAPIDSTSEMFSKTFVNATTITNLTKDQMIVKRLAEKIAQKFIGVNINVVFLSSPSASVVADYGDRTLRFNVPKLPSGFFNNPLANPEVYDLLIHELGHHNGNHTEKGYHQLITKLAGQLIVEAQTNPAFFEGCL
jgi:hypothetical protein